MSHVPAITEIKAFVPARDFRLSQAFYVDMGFTLVWSSEDLACFRHAGCSFLLQNFHVEAHSHNFMMHMLVDDVDAWWDHIVARDIAVKYGVRVIEPTDQPWSMRDFVIIDPTGVLWRIGQNIPTSDSA